MIRTIFAILVCCTAFCPAQSVITNFRQVSVATPPSGGAPTFVQACDSNAFAGAGDGASCVLPSVGAGDVLLIVSTAPSGVNATVSVNGVDLDEPLDAAKDDTVRLWIYPNTGAGNNPVVVRQDATGTTRLLVAEFGNVSADPLDAFVQGVCDSGCPYLGSITTPSLTVAANDVVWSFCKADYGGNYAVLSDTPEPMTEISQSQGIEYTEGYRVVSGAGSTYVKCDQLAAGVVWAVAIKGK